MIEVSGRYDRVIYAHQIKMTTTIPADTAANSESESLDSLDYDDWEGQFEFIGNNTNINSTSSNSSNPNGYALTVPKNGVSDDAEDLNLNTGHTNISNGNAAILIDELTFLTVPSDSDNILFTNEPVGHQSPSSGYFIENALTNFDSVPFNGKQRIKENNNISNLVNNNNNNSNRNNNNIKHNNNSNIIHQLHHNHQSSIDDVINIKNKLNHLTDQRNNNSDSNCKINGFSADLCDNLTEQVSKAINNPKKKNK